MFDKEESVALLEMVMEQQATSDIEKLRPSNVDWAPISRALERAANPVKAHYDCAIWTPLARLLSVGDESEVDAWKIEFCRAILADKTVTERRAIQWREMHGRFPDVGPYAMLNFIGNCTKRHEKTVTFRERIQHYLNNPPDPRRAKNWRLGYELIWEQYSKLRETYA